MLGNKAAFFAANTVKEKGIEGMTDTQIITTILEGRGWKQLDQDGPFDWHNGNEVIPEEYANQILTSLDACHEVFEKDAPDEYWRWLAKLMCPGVANAWMEQIGMCKATPRQRCLTECKRLGKEPSK